MRTALGVAAALMAVTPVAAQAATPSAEAEAAKTEIWTMEQAIYLGRSKGDMSNYANNTAAGYLAWPPVSAVPMGRSNFKEVPPEQRKSQEELKLSFVDFSLHGDTAVIYYKTHRTRLADGTPANDHFDVTHTWVKEGGRWQVFAGMARASVNP